ncbi:MAG: hypothetical protein ACK42H_11470 [Planctomycetota bacterium]|jgi:hypothetical protein
MNEALGLSSNYHPPALSGVVTLRGIPVGSIAIPKDSSEEFIQEFELQYRSLGLGARMIPSSKLTSDLPSLPKPNKNQNPHDPDS